MSTAFLRNRGTGPLPPPPPRDDEPLLDRPLSSTSSATTGGATTAFLIILGLVLAAVLTLSIVTAVDHFSHQRVSSSAVLNVSGVSATNVNATTITATNVTVHENIHAGGNLTANGTVMARQFMALEILAHNASGVIPPTHARQTLTFGGILPPAVNETALLPISNLTVNSLVSVPGGKLGFKINSGTWQVRDLITADPYTSVSDTGGIRVLQGGLPNDFGGPADCSDDLIEPTNRQKTSITIVPLIAGGGVVTIYLRYGSELGYDFVTVSQGTQTLFSNSGAGPSATNAFLEQTITVNLRSADSVTIDFDKDAICWGGYDIVYFYVTLAPPAALTMTLPADLSSYVGKDIQICSQDAAAHLLSLEGTGKHFDVAGEWPVMQFQGNGQDACCLTLSVTTPDRLQVKSRDACSVFCDSLQQLHCVDPLRPAETSPFHGWWKSTLKTTREYSYAQLDARTNPMTLSIHAGTVNNPQEAVSESRSLYPRKFLTFSESPTADLAASFDASSVRLFSFQIGFSVFVQHTGYENTASDTGNVVFGLFEKVGQLPSVALVPASTGTLTDRSPEDPVQMMRNYFDYLLFGYYSSLNADDKWIGYLPAKALLEEIIATGKTHTQNITKTLVTMSFNPEGITEFRTADYHHVAPPARVHVTGFTGGCAVLNSPPEGHLVTASATTNSPLPSPLFEDYGPNPDQRTVHHKIGVFLNSASVPVFPGTNTANCTGDSPTITVSYGPITSATSYIGTVGAINYWFYEAMKIGFHCRPFLFYDAFSSFPRSGVAYPLEEWADVIEFASFSDDDFPTVFIEKRMNSRDESSTSGFSPKSPGLELISMRLESQTLDRRRFQGLVDLTGRFGIRPDRETLSVFQTDNLKRSTHGYTIALENYLEQVAYPAYAFVGTSRSGEANLYAQLVSTNGNGDEFNTVMVPYGQLPPNDYSYVDLRATLNGGPSSLGPYSTTLYTWDNLITQQSFFAGRIKTNLTSGVSNIGYIRMDAVSQIDPFNLAIDSSFCPTGLCNASSFRNNNEALMSIFATVMQYLRVDLSCEHVILDVRHNLGGFGPVLPGLANFFGGDDRFLFDGSAGSRTDTGNSNSVQLKSLLFGTKRLEASDNAFRSSPTLSETNYPGSVWQNAEFVFLTDTAAGSAGDLLPNVFLGDVGQSGNLGGGVQTTMVGSVDGRITGYAGAFSLPFSRDDGRIKNSNGDARTPFRTTSEQGLGIRRVDGTYFANRVPGLEIDYARATGLAGGNPLWADWEELVYKDLGYVNNTRPILPGWTGSQTPEAYLVSNVISTVSGSNIVTVTLPFAHNFSTGDDISLGSTVRPVSATGGLSSRVLTGGQIITVVNATTFTFQTSDVGTNYNGPAFIGSLFAGLGTGPDGPSFSFTSPAATSTVINGGGGPFYVMRRSAWRDAWLEQSIATVIAQAKKKKRSPTTRNVEYIKARQAALKEARQAARFDIHEANKRYGRNVACPTSRVHLVSPRDMPATVNFTIHINSADLDDEIQQNREALDIRQKIGAILRSELESGGMCLDSQGRLMATPSCKQNPKVVMEGPATPTHVVAGKKRQLVKKTRGAPEKAFASYEACMQSCADLSELAKRKCELKCANLFPEQDFQN